MSGARSIGQQAISEIVSLWKVAPSKTIRRDDGFDWWPGDFKVSVDAHQRKDGREPETWWVTVRTDFLKDVPIADGKFVRLAAATSRFCTSTYAWVYPPAEAWAAHGQAGERPKLWSANTAYVTSDNVNWLPGFLARMSIMQPINAQIQAAGMSDVLGGGVPDVSRPERLRIDGLDDILEMAAQVYVPMGSGASRWIGTDEFRFLADSWGRSDYCFGTGDDQGLTLETSFRSDSALIRLRTDEKHPQLGSGMLATLQLPTFGTPDSIANDCAFYNLLDTFWNDIPLFGCWHPSTSRGGQESPAFSSFVPNALYSPGIASHTVLWLLDRARMVRRERFPQLEDKPMPQILNDRQRGEAQ
jgi:hypothetical protein